MSMGNIESYHQVVPTDVLKKVVGKKLLDKWNKAKNTLLDTLNIGDNEVADALDGDFWGSIDPDSEEWVTFDKATDEIRAAFKKETKLDLVPLFTAGDGDCYDDLDDDKWYWEIDTDDVWVRKMTPAAAAFVKKYGKSAINTDARFSCFG